LGSLTCSASFRSGSLQALSSSSCSLLSLQRRAEGTELRRVACGQARQRKRPDTIPPRPPPFHSWQPLPPLPPTERAWQGKQPATPRRPHPPACARGRSTKLTVRGRAPMAVPPCPAPHATCPARRPPPALMPEPRAATTPSSSPSPRCSPSSSPRRWETAVVMAPRWKSGDGRRRLLLLLCCCLLAFPCHAQVTNVSHRSDQGSLIGRSSLLMQNCR